MRPLRSEESQVLEALLGMVPRSAQPPLEKELFAVDLSDGGMGSIRLAGKSDPPRKMSKELMTANYIDEDQIPVIISLNLDQDGRLFELDFWKVDFNPLKRYPTPAELQRDQPSTSKPTQ